MAYESEEQVAFRIRKSRIEHSQRALEGTLKTLSKKQLEEYHDLVNNKIDSDPIQLIRLRESTVNQIRGFAAMGNQGVSSGGQTYDETVNRMIKLAESALAHGLR